jgi:aminopeptidase-like protein
MHAQYSGIDDVNEDYLLRFAEKIFPFNRSLTGLGNVMTLNSIKELLPDLKVLSVKSGTKIFDWEVPEEWNVSDAYIICPDGNKICDFSTNNLHLVGYSDSFEGEIELSELQEHLYSNPNQPTAIPYVTSYYERNWGFCIADADRKELKSGRYKVVIRAKKEKGTLNYAELVLPGRYKKEVLLSTYICHPSMANNEVSGITVTTFLARWLAKNLKRKYTYRIVFVPETIGSLVYIKKNLKKLKKNVIAGYVVTCVGDEGPFSFLPSRDGQSLSNQVAIHTLKKCAKKFNKYLWEERGSDERQYCAPGIDLPVASVMKTKYGIFPEYHTSLDQIGTVVTNLGLQQSYQMYIKLIQVLENFMYPRATVLGEPQLGKRNLYQNISRKDSNLSGRCYLNILTWADGKTSILEIAERLDIFVLDLIPYVNTLVKHSLLKVNDKG